MREFFREHKLYEKSKKFLAKAEGVAAEYQAQGLKLTVRQLYYQMVSRGVIENNQTEYKKLVRILTAARESGVFDWAVIEDRGRTSHHPYFQESPDSILSGIEYHLSLNRWAVLDHYVEVWVEKQALEAVVERACDPLFTPYMACKGYLSASEAYRAGQRFARAAAQGKKPVLIHLGDHDPSGMHMTSDNRDRVRLFARENGIQVDRIALNMDQIDEHRPPPNPAKMTDTRAKDYVAEYGTKSWELDALKPEVLDDVIKEAIEPYIDRDAWADLEDREEELRAPLAALGDNWEEVKQLMEEAGLV